MNQTISFNTPQESETPYTISEINNGIARLIESGNTLVWVEGEISNWKPSSSGHCYFRLKDAECQIPAVIWRSSIAQLTCKPEDGMAVMVIASIRVYQKGGYYQLDVHRLQPVGSGALAVAFEKLKYRLQREGLFDVGHKKPLPESITRIGVITSKHGAALRDIVRVTVSRSPQTEIVLIDVPVQGEKAAGEIAAALERMAHYQNVDCIIVGRGGGSTEDLWAFNEEVVARAIYNSKIPVISAVGHEIDFTIADYVADVRAPTPSAAAEIAVADNKERTRFFYTQQDRFTYLSRKFFSSVVQRYTTAARSSAFKKPFRQFLEFSQHIDELTMSFSNRTLQLLKDYQTRLMVAGTKFNALSPLGVLSRGYSVVSDKNNHVVKDSTDLVPGDPVLIRFFQGAASAQITEITHHPNETTS